MTLVELTKLWKSKELTEDEVVREYQNIKIFRPVAEDGEIYYTNGNGNSWLEVRMENNLKSEDIKKFKHLVSALSSHDF